MLPRSIPVFAATLVLAQGAFASTPAHLPSTNAYSGKPHPSVSRKVHGHSSAPKGSGSSNTAHHHRSPKPFVAEGPVRDDPRETHLANLKQLTFGGENAEAYWSPDGTQFSFQSSRDGNGCDRIYRMRADGTGLKQISSGQGVTTCAHFLGNNHIVYGSTFLKRKDCPPKPDHSRGYVWGIHPEYDIFVRRTDGLGLKRLTTHPGYDAEATVSPDGNTILFTSLRTGDPELFLMNADGSNKRQITNELGYDGGGFFTPDGSKIVWRRTARMNAKEALEYQTLLRDNLVKPGKMDLWVMDQDGSNKREVLANGAANFAPFGLPDGSGMIFASNMDDPRGRNFDMYTIGYDGKNLKRITYYEGFDSFPMFSPDGKKILFSSNRFGSKRGETNVFLADWRP